MKPYETMAIVYDDLTEDIPYDVWYGKIKTLLDTLPQKPYQCLEIGVGTGNMTGYLLNDSYHLTVIEPSEAMLSVFQEKYQDHMGKLKFFNGTWEAFESQMRFDVAFAFLDVLNYVAPSRLSDFFEKVARHLKPQAMLMIDWSSPYKLKEVIGNQTIAEHHEDFAYIWDNHFDCDNQQLQFDFVMFTELEDGTFERSIEHHIQYCHTIEAVREAASHWFDGFEVKGDYYGPLTEASERYHMTLRKVAT